MRVFVTGATGWVGSAVVQELIDSGHRVLGLARSAESAKALSAQGADVQHGSLDDIDRLRDGAASCDGVIHTAFKRDFGAFEANADLDRRVIEAMGDELAGSGRPMVTTSGSLIIALKSPGRLATESDAGDASVPRVSSELATVALAERDVRSSVLRLPPSVHGSGDRGFVPRLIDIARETGVSAYVGDGANRWPAAHRRDAARAFRLALETGRPGSRYQAIHDEGVPIRELAECIGRHTGLPTRSITPDEARPRFGFLSMFIGLDAPASSVITRDELGWSPRECGLIADLETGAYFNGTISKFSEV